MVQVLPWVAPERVQAKLERIRSSLFMTVDNVDRITVVSIAFVCEHKGPYALEVYRVKSLVLVVICRQALSRRCLDHRLVEPLLITRETRSTEIGMHQSRMKTSELSQPSNPQC